MTTEELRELDAWIAENLFGMKHDWRNCHWCQSSDPYALNNGHFQRYTSDPAAAMEVLKKLSSKCEEMSGDLVISSGGIWTVGIQRYAEYGGAEEIDPLCEAETLELAICLFAKKLFVK